MRRKAEHVLCLLSADDAGVSFKTFSNLDSISEIFSHEFSGRFAKPGRSLREQEGLMTIDVCIDSQYVSFGDIMGICIGPHDER